MQNSRMWCLGLAGSSLLVLSTCAHEPLGPAPGPAERSAQQFQGNSVGVHVLAKTEAWNGDPPTLAQYVLPVWVQIENHSGKALWLSTDTLSITDATGGRVLARALPAATIKGKAKIPETAVPAEFGLQDPWLDTWLEPGFDEYVAASIHWQENLPTKEMLRRAIREGVLRDGAKVAGFVYFPKTTQDPSTLNLRAELLDATTRQSFGRVDIPLAMVLGSLP